MPKSSWGLMQLLAYLLVLCHCCQSRSWGTSLYPDAPSTLGGVPHPRASLRTTGTPKSGAGHWTPTPHSSESTEKQQEPNLTQAKLANHTVYKYKYTSQYESPHLVAAFLSSPHIENKDSVEWSAGKQVQVADVIKKPWQGWLQANQMRR